MESVEVSRSSNGIPQEPAPKRSYIDEIYKWPADKVEYERLDAQHEMLNVALEGQLVRAPIDYKDPQFQALDSATADGRWLRDLAPKLAPTASLVGTDILPEQFPRRSSLPPNISLQIQSIFDPWPTEYHDRFDLVHQRFVLSTCSVEEGEGAIKSLYECVKPGGYIQLQEGDMTLITEGEQHQAMTRFRDLMMKAWPMLNKNMSPAPQLSGWLEAFGAKIIREEVLTNKAGPMAENKEQGERAIKVLQHLLAAVEGIGNQIKGFFFTSEDFAELKRDLENELRAVGNTWQYHIVVAQKPVG